MLPCPMLPRAPFLIPLPVISEIPCLEAVIVKAPVGAFLWWELAPGHADHLLLHLGRVVGESQVSALTLPGLCAVGWKAGSVSGRCNQEWIVAEVGEHCALLPFKPVSGSAHPA